jgi:hypothetical protein
VIVARSRETTRAQASTVCSGGSSQNQKFHNQSKSLVNLDSHRNAAGYRCCTWFVNLGVPHDKQMHRWRHLLENYFAKIMEFRGFAARYDKTDSSYGANLFIAATIIAVR